jgi:hypothetical protein
MWQAFLAYGFFALALVSFMGAMRGWRFPLVPRSKARALDAPLPSVIPQTEATEYSRQPIFDQALPELADMSPASLQELFAGRTDAQAETIVKQHVGKPVRVSGVVEGVDLGHSGEIPQVHLRSGAAQLLLFSDDHDSELAFRALNVGDRIVVSAEIYRIVKNLVSLIKCKLIDVRVV